MASGHEEENISIEEENISSVEQEENMVYNLNHDDDDLLTLSLSTAHHSTTALPPPPPTPPPPSLASLAISPPPELPDAPIAPPPEPEPAAAEPVAPRIRGRKRKRMTKSDTIPATFPWSATSRANVRSMEFLRANQISIITGDVQCKKCDQRFQMEFNLEEKFLEISTFIAQNKEDLRQRAPKEWMSPVLLDCRFCTQKKCVKPVIAERKRLINWLFLLLGKMLGCCTLEQLKYFCKHTKTHRTGAKDRVLFLAYLGLCKQLDPSGPFDI